MERTERQPRAAALGLTAQWWPAVAIVAAVALLAVAYYRAVWGAVPALVEALDHCRELYCDFTRQYYPTGRDVLTTGQPSRGYYYSSFFALLLTPWGRLGPEAAAVWWSLAQLAGIGLLLVPAADFYRRSPAAFALYIALLAFSMPLLHNLKWGQVSTLVTGAAFVSLSLSRRGRWPAAAVVLALAAAVKYYVAVVLITHLARRDWRFLAGFAVAFVALWLVVPTLVLGVDGNLAFYATVRERVAHAVTSWMSTDINAQYMPSVIGRWLSAGPGRAFWRVLGYAIFAANALAVARLARRDTPRAAEWSFALLFLSLPFAIETSWPHYFVYLPFAQTLAALALTERAPYIKERATAGLRAAYWGGWGLLLASVVLASMPFFQWIGRWQDYSRPGYLFVANLCVFILAHALTRRAGAAANDHPATAATTAAGAP